METCQDIGLKGEDLRMEFISAFRPHTVKHWKLPLLPKWTTFLIKRDVYVKKVRRVDKVQDLIYIMYRDCHICMAEKQEENPTKIKNIPSNQIPRASSIMAPISFPLAEVSDRTDPKSFPSSQMSPYAYPPPN